MQGTSPGEVLLEARRSRDISIEYIARQLRLTVVQIDAIENDDYTLLPATIFVQGYIRGYANILGLDSEPLVERFIEVVGAAAQPSLASSAREKKSQHNKNIIPIKSIGYMAISSFIVLALFLIYNSKNVEDDFPSESQASAKKSESVSVGLKTGNLAVKNVVSTRQAGSRKLNSSQDTLSIRFKKATYIEVFDATNRALLAHTGRAGFRDKVKGKAPFRIKLGKPEYVEVRLNGEIFNHLRLKKKGIQGTILVNTN
ncbi:hypothetical protein MNBD_GAMMA12-3599 [hydrothermal vent metagenome]|uniref:Cytoskeleton protein RodZ-like C-terminal domain-containing protein n=1 Tax=hydrothermal vent metagenome TaxID=652676 RepID=A0A3B0Z099_9ZZZZ